ncbi:MAG TPA: ribosome biogenesis GTPase Der, partial [Thermomicrobiales bacterium]|nr:ribosome biogenesis GTPase Der [Thermomicrobiales bacterium]
MIPILALVGRPNVGKSTLFNRLTGSRDALVGDMPGLTRDRHYGYAVLDERRVALIDTGGLAGESELALAAESQTWRAIGECDHILFLVDARTGLGGLDEELAARLRASGKPVWLLVNKAEGLPESEFAEFQRLGFAQTFAISAKRNSGIGALAGAIVATLPAASEQEERPQDGLAVAIIGRPNVGKSTLVNRLVGEDRVLASDMPGTTRDAIRVPLERDGRRYVLIDTAGFRKRASVEEGVERLGVTAAIRALEEATVAIVMSDVAEGVTSQDQRLVRLALDRGRAVVVALNKWDGLGRDARARAAASA